jgi:hypothetical protein
MVAQTLQKTSFANKLLWEKGSKTSKLYLSNQYHTEFRCNSENRCKVKSITICRGGALAYVPGARTDLPNSISFPAYCSNLPINYKELEASRN